MNTGSNHGRCEVSDGRTSYKAYEGAICQECGEACQRVRLVPEFAFLGCDACYDGCMAMLAEEEAVLWAVAERKLARAGIWISQVPSASAMVTLAIANQRISQVVH